MKPFYLTFSFCIFCHTRFSVHLRLRDNNLAGVGIVSVFDWMVQQADDPNNPTHFLHPVGDVAGITQELLTAEKLEKQKL